MNMNSLVRKLTQRAEHLRDAVSSAQFHDGISTARPELLDGLWAQVDLLYEACEEIRSDEECDI